MLRWVVLLAAVGVSACGGVGGLDAPHDPPGTQVHAVLVAPDSTSLVPGRSLPFTAQVDAEAGQTDRSVTWRSSDAEIASVTPAGVVTAGNKLGRAYIIAASKADPTVMGAAVVTVASPPTAPAALR
jgi:uncharacterized protein YjdB